MAIPEWQLLRSVCIECINPPVLGVRGSAAEIEAPSGIGWQDHRAFEGGRAEGLATDLADGLEVDAVPRLSDDDTDSTTGVERASKAVRQPEDAIH
jgi:hypothetical protein